MSQKVIYIAGHGHSGSTLLDLLIGSHPRVESVGEVTGQSLRRLFGHDTSLPCTCGENFATCAYWKRVLKLWSARGITFPDHVLAPADPSFAAGAISDILSVSGRSISAESTKNGARLEYLLSVPNMDVFVIHLMRDPRAVALSLDRKYGNFLKTARAWRLVQDRITTIMRPHPDRLLRVQYEDLVTNPESQLRRIMAFCGETFDTRQLDYSSKVHHNISGNRMRFDASTIVPDTRYLEQVLPFQWYAATALAFGALKKYGYHLSRAGMRQRLSPPTKKIHST